MKKDLDAFGTTIMNAGLLVQQDAEWYVDLDDFGALFDVDVSVVGLAPASVSIPAKIALWASPTQGNTGGSGVKLAEVTLPLGGTGGIYAGARISAQVANPGGKQYLALVSTGGDS